MITYKELLNTNRTLIFDLDNTIYRELDYLSVVFDRISELTSITQRKNAYHYLVDNFKMRGRKNLLDNFILQFELKIEIPELLKLYRTCEIGRQIDCFPWFYEFSKEFKGDKSKLRIITNGNPQQQRNKIRNIRFPAAWTSFEVIYANEIRAKPAPDSFFKLSNCQNFNDPIYLGDSIVDKEFCINTGLEFCDVNIMK